MPVGEKYYGKSVKLGSGLGLPGSMKEEACNLQHNSQGSPSEECGTETKAGTR